MDASLRRLIWRRANDTCEYCRISQSLDDLPFEIDHIIASKHRGPTIAGNLALSCYYCNAFKGPNIAGVDSKSEKITPLFHPRHEEWIEHFEWNGPVVVGLTPTGRATIDVLRMNQPERVSLRAALIDEGVFPT